MTIDVYHRHSVIATFRMEGDRMGALKFAHARMAEKGFRPNEYHLEVSEEQL